MEAKECIVNLTKSVLSCPMWLEYRISIRPFVLICQALLVSLTLIMSCVSGGAVNQ